MENDSEIGTDTEKDILNLLIGYSVWKNGQIYSYTLLIYTEHKINNYGVNSPF
jgi:hypothetical protein